MKKTETLWVYLPETEQQAIEDIIRYMKEKELGSCSVEDLLNKLVFNEADDWIQVLNDYNKILPIKIRLKDMQLKVKELRRQFQRYQPELKDKDFEAHELLALVILCYVNPELIGKNLSSALTKEDSDAIYNAIIDNSDWIRKTRTGPMRMTSETSNLRLLNYALYANDSSVQLTDEIKDKIIADAAKKNITVVIATDQPILVEDLNNFIEVPILSNHTVLPGKNNLLIGISNWDQLGNVSILRNIVSFLQDQKLAFNIFSTNKSLPVLEGQTVNEENSEICDCFGPMDEDFLKMISLSNLESKTQIHNESDEVNNITTMDPNGENQRIPIWKRIEMANEQKPIYEIQPYGNEELASTHNTTRVTRETHAYSTANASSHTPDILVSALVGLHILKNIPVLSPVLRNLGKSIGEGAANVARYTGSFFRPISVANSTEVQNANAMEQKATFNRV